MVLFLMGEQGISESGFTGMEGMFLFGGLFFVVSPTY